MRAKLDYFARDKGFNESGMIDLSVDRDMLHQIVLIIKEDIRMASLTENYERLEQMIGDIRELLKWDGFKEDEDH